MATESEIFEELGRSGGACDKTDGNDKDELVSEEESQICSLIEAKKSLQGVR